MRVRFTVIMLLGLVAAGCAAAGDRAPSAAGSDEGPGRLQGSAWRLEDLGGAGVLDGAEATLEFHEPDRIGGSGSCNRFFGPVEISGDSLRIGMLGSTRRSCEEAVMTQEAHYLEALQAAERIVLDGATLLIFAAGMESPLRFVQFAPKSP